MIVNILNYLDSLEFGTPDPRYSKNPISYSPFRFFLFNLAYLAFVYKIGPAYMENRKPFKLKNTLLVYNFAQVILNCIAPICGFIAIVDYRALDPGCMTALPRDHPLKHLEVLSFSTYHLLKYVDFMDTMFFVLRKSTRQITFLHVYHHLMMATLMYLISRYNGYGGHVGIMGIMNSLVHVVMYFYYFTSALRTSLRALWWKKYITILQLTQFVLIFLHNLYPLLYRPNCKYPRSLIYMGLF